MFSHNSSLEPDKKGKDLLCYQLKMGLTKAIEYTPNSVLNKQDFTFSHMRSRQLLAMIQWLKDGKTVIMSPLAFPS